MNAGWDLNARTTMWQAMCLPTALAGRVRTVALFVNMYQRYTGTYQLSDSNYS